MNQAITGDAMPGSDSAAGIPAGNDLPAGHGDAAAVLASHVATGTLPGIRQVIEGWGGRPDATVIGTGARVPAHNAALVNSALVRAMELDAGHRGHDGMVSDIDYLVNINNLLYF
jgi:MmgE/PrpD N-terminal domain